MQEYRCTGDHLTKLKAAQDELNKLYSSSIITEFAFNGAGILEHVSIRTRRGHTGRSEQMRETMPA